MPTLLILSLLRQFQFLSKIIAVYHSPSHASHTAWAGNINPPVMVPRKSQVTSMLSKKCQNIPPTRNRGNIKTFAIQCISHSIASFTPPIITEIPIDVTITTIIVISHKGKTTLPYTIKKTSFSIMRMSSTQQFTW